MCNGRRTLIIFAAWLFAAQAQAIQITSAGQSWTVNWSYDLGTSGLLGSTSTWTVNYFSASQIVLSIDIANTSKLISKLGNADITAFGFGTNPNTRTSLLSAGNVFTRVGTGSGPQQTFPGGFKGINVCLFAQGCSGGTVNKALHAGSRDRIQLLLSGNFSGGVADLLYMPLKFQTSLGSYKSAGCINCPPVGVPEPSIAALLGLGLLLIGLSQRRVRRIVAAARR
jgi:hypothetical protein